MKLGRSIDPQRPELVYDTRWSVVVKLVPRDVWIGVYWTDMQRVRTRGAEFGEPYFSHGYGNGSRRVEEQKTYVCLLPCLPIVVTRTRETAIPYYSQ